MYNFFFFFFTAHSSAKQLQLISISCIGRRQDTFGESEFLPDTKGFNARDKDGTVTHHRQSSTDTVRSERTRWSRRQLLFGPTFQYSLPPGHPGVKWPCSGLVCVCVCVDGTESFVSTFPLSGGSRERRVSLPSELVVVVVVVLWVFLPLVGSGERENHCVLAFTPRHGTGH